MRCLSIVFLFTIAIQAFSQSLSVDTLFTKAGKVYVGVIEEWKEGLHVKIKQNNVSYFVDWTNVGNVKSARHSFVSPSVADSTPLKRNKPYFVENSSSLRYYTKPRLLLGPAWGWGNTAGLGPEFSVLFKGYVDINFGVGFDFGGGRAALGTRVFLLGRRKVNPWLGAAIAVNSGLGKVFISLSGQTLYYRIPGGFAAHIKGGLRINRRNFAAIISGGYGFPLKNYNWECIDCGHGHGPAEFYWLARTLGPGNLEISCSFLFRLNGEYFPLRYQPK